MKYKKTNAFVINKISVMLLVLALCMSLVMPMAGINVYAGNEDKSVAAEEIQKDADAKESTKESDTEKTGTDTSGSEKKAKTAKIQTTITGYQTSYNKRYNQDLLIEADITPADGRDVQLQRYNSEEDNWTTILTASPAPDPVTEPEENSEETAAQAEVTEQAAGSGEAETAAADTASAAGAAENVADTGVALSNDPATLTEEDGVAHVTFNIPQEERQKTTSTWRIHINGTKKGSGLQGGHRGGIQFGSERLREAPVTVNPAVVVDQHAGVEAHDTFGFIGIILAPIAGLERAVRTGALGYQRIAFPPHIVGIKVVSLRSVGIDDQTYVRGIQDIEEAFFVERLSVAVCVDTEDDAVIAPVLQIIDRSRPDYLVPAAIHGTLDIVRSVDIDALLPGMVRIFKNIGFAVRNVLP